VYLRLCFVSLNVCDANVEYMVVLMFLSIKGNYADF